MASERDIFQLSGPRHLIHINWSDTDHRRCVAASLVQGVYVHERDRQQRRIGPDALAPFWCSFFHFKLLQPLLDKIDGSIFGAVYKYTKKGTALQTRPPNAPKIVIAIRGTIAKGESRARDLQLDLNLVTNGLHTTCRFQAALDAVKTSIDRHGAVNVWIAGHSLGAAMALLAGRKMVEERGLGVEAHLFNPPFVSPPVERIKNSTIKSGLHVARSFVTAGLAMTLQDKRARTETQRVFNLLASWIPFLYVNFQDDLCSGYIGYFSNQQTMQRMGVGGLANLAAQHSIGEIIQSAFGTDSKAIHLVPSAKLGVSLKQAPTFKQAHGIHQWWAPDLQIQSTEYRLLQPKITSA